MKKLRVTVEGKTYEVTVETVETKGAAPAPVAKAAAPAPVVAPAPVAAPAAPVVAAGAKDIASPLAGKVVSIDTQVGANVANGAQVITIEAMKMNTCIYAHTDGKVAKIHVGVGDGVTEGQVLVSLA